MTVRLTRFLTLAERDAMNAEARAKGWYYEDRRMFTPGMGWFEPWYFDPQGLMPGHTARRRQGDPFLSIHYWQTWSAVRAPIAVVGPNGSIWEIDRKSSNGSGWVVTGEWPNLTCSPSIVLDGYPDHGIKGYHGFLQNGAFTPDLEGRTYG